MFAHLCSNTTALLFEKVYNVYEIEQAYFLRENHCCTKVARTYTGIGQFAVWNNSWMCLHIK